jgi:hypothetical protein
MPTFLFFLFFSLDMVNYALISVKLKWIFLLNLGVRSFADIDPMWLYDEFIAENALWFHIFIWG